MPAEWARIGSWKRKVHVLANRAWRAEHAQFGPRPIVIALHDEWLDARPAAMAKHFAPLVYTPGDPSPPPPSSGGGGGGGGDTGYAAAIDPDIHHTHFGHFVVLCPEGLQAGIEVARPDQSDEVLPTQEPRGSFHSGHRGFDARSLNSDDVGAIERQLHRVLLDFQSALDGAPAHRVPRRAADRALDPTAVFVVGHGNGAEMAFRLAVELAAAAVTADREYEVRVRGVGSYGGGHGGSRLGGSFMDALWHPIDASTVVGVIHGDLDDDFASRAVWLTPSEATERVLSAMGASATPPSSTSGDGAATAWTPLGARWVSVVAPQLGTEAFTMVVPGVGLQGYKVFLRFVGHDWVKTPDPIHFDPAILFWNLFATAERVWSGSRRADGPIHLAALHRPARGTGRAPSMAA